MAEHRSEPVTPQAAAEIAQVDERVRARLAVFWARRVQSHIRHNRGNDQWSEGF